MYDGLKSLTFFDIEKIKGINYNEIENQESPLQLWYNKIRNKKILDLSICDICRSIRQKIFLEYIILEAIERLFDDPTIGAFYDFEMLKALSEIDREFWANNSQITNKIKELINFLNNQYNISDRNWLFDEEKDFYNILKDLSNNV